MKPFSRPPRRFAFLLITAAALLWCMSGVAFAHITVHPSKAAPGSEATFTFRVPNEEAHANTDKLTFVLPSSNPIPVVSLQPLPGWTAHVRTHRLAKPVQTDDGPVSEAVSRIVWSADEASSAIAPGEFQQFTIEAGPLPKARLLVFKVVQYYSDGTVVRWIDRPRRGEELAHPAPVVTLAPDAPATGGARSTSASGPVSVTVSGDGWIAVSAFVAGLLGFAVGTSAMVRVRRSGTHGSSGAKPE